MEFKFNFIAKQSEANTKWTLSKVFHFSSNWTPQREGLSLLVLDITIEPGEQGGKNSQSSLTFGLFI